MASSSDQVPDPGITWPEQALVVADVSLVRWEICDLLRENGIIPLETASAEEALCIAEKFACDVVLISLWSSPDCGAALAKELRQRSSTPIVVSCGHARHPEFAGLNIVPAESYDTSAVIRLVLKSISEKNPPA